MCRCCSSSVCVCGMKQCVSCRPVRVVRSLREIIALWNHFEEVRWALRLKQTSPAGIVSRGMGESAPGAAERPTRGSLPRDERGAQRVEARDARVRRLESDTRIGPSARRSTVTILNNVAGLSAANQSRLLAWIGRDGSRTQVISTSERPLFEAVTRGVFDKRCTIA